MHFFPTKKTSKMYMHFLWYKKCLYTTKTIFFEKTDDMHFLGWPGISKICIFLGKMHIFQDPGLEKKCIYAISRKFVYAFFGVAWNLKNMHFPRENAYFSGSRAGKKMHIRNFPKNVVYAFFGVTWNLKNMHFPRENAYFSGSRAGKKMYISIFSKKKEKFHRYAFSLGKCIFL